jgi:hypothetical protein
MTSILRDNKGSIYHIQTCKYCTDYKGRPKPILPEDMWGAKMMPDGSYKCLTCQTEEIQEGIFRVTPNSDRAKEIIAERREAERKELVFKRREAEIRKV